MTTAEKTRRRDCPAAFSVFEGAWNSQNDFAKLLPEHPFLRNAWDENANGILRPASALG
ncbi:MAG: hypothetical protein AB7U97_27545 [Pirellulales bacterium]